MVLNSYGIYTRPNFNIITCNMLNLDLETKPFVINTCTYVRGKYSSQFYSHLKNNVTSPSLIISSLSLTRYISDLGNYTRIKIIEIVSRLNYNYLRQYTPYKVSSLVSWKKLREKICNITFGFLVVQ